MTAMLLPESWLVQPPVVPLHVARDPKRKYLPAQAAEIKAKRLTTYAVLPNLNKQRLQLAGMAPPDDVSLRILMWIVSAGDKRWWSWSATKREARGKIRNSLQWELGADPAHVSRSVRRLLTDGVVEIVEKHDGRELIRFTDLGKVVLAEVDWRHKMRNAVPDLEPLAAQYGWQELSLQIDRFMVVEGLDYDRLADIRYAAKTQLGEGVSEGGPIEMPASWQQ